MYNSISNFRSRLAALLKVKRGVYAGAQQLTISDNDLADLVEQYITELQDGTLEGFEI